SRGGVRIPRLQKEVLRQTARDTRCFGGAAQQHDNLPEKISLPAGCEVETQFILAEGIDVA
ncbi:MAG: hypothetical protein WBP47_06585, partial [Candidatus Promineifilaceae bacterium]